MEDGVKEQNTVELASTPTGQPSYAELQARIAQLESERQATAKTGLRLQVAKESKGISVYGLGRFPVTLGREQWVRLVTFLTGFDESDQADMPFAKFAEEHRAEIFWTLTEKRAGAIDKQVEAKVQNTLESAFDKAVATYRAAGFSEARAIELATEARDKANKVKGSAVPIRHIG